MNKKEKEFGKFFATKLNPRLNQLFIEYDSILGWKTAEILTKRMEIYQYIFDTLEQEIDRAREEGKKEGLAELLKFVKQWDKKYQMNKAQELEQFISNFNHIRE